MWLPCIKSGGCRVNFPAVVGCCVVWGGGVVFRAVVFRASLLPCMGFYGVGWAVGRLSSCRALWGLYGGLYGVGWCSLLFVPSAAMIAGESFRLLCSLLFVGVPCLCGAVCCRPWVFPCLIRSRGLWGLLGGFIAVFQAP